MLYQCIGISGAILFVYGLLTMAFTGISQDWFVRGMVLFGLLGLATFVLKSLDRVWQKLVVFFVGGNVVWALFAIGQAWPWYGLVIPIGVIAGLVVLLRKAKFDVGLLIFLVLSAGLIGLYFADQDAQVHSAAALVAAILLNVAAFLLSKAELLRANQDQVKFTKRTIVYVYGLIVLIIMVVVNVLSQDFHKQWDATANKINTLSKQSTKVVSKLEAPLAIKVFLKKDNQSKAFAKILFGLFENASKKIQVHYLDPDVEKSMTESVGAKDGDIVVSYQDKTYTTQTLSEEGITQALLKVSSGAKAHLCFVGGHGELMLDGAEDNVRSLSVLKGGLDNEGYTYQTLTQITDVIDPKCHIVIVAGPRQALAAHEGDAIDRFLDAGGKALLLLDPIFSNPNLGEKVIKLKPTGLEKTLFKWGVELGRNLLLQRTIQMYQGEQVVSKITGFQYGSHPIVDPLKGKQTLFDGVQSVHARPDFEGTTYDLLSSFGQGATWSKSNMKELMVDQNAAPGPDDLEGPVPFIVASEKESTTEGQGATQIIVAGDADFISNDLMVGNEYNYDLMLNMLGWLTGSDENISIRPKRFQTSAIELTPAQSKTIFYVVIVLLPMLVLLFGINLWWIRRNRG